MGGMAERQKQKKKTLICLLVYLALPFPHLSIFIESLVEDVQHIIESIFLPIGAIIFFKISIRANNYMTFYGISIPMSSRISIFHIAS